ncbi:hypothetical protein GGR56DRAFT_142053 [Xylariaceae sp. FL0804]|nr:hypothetical protein GGR56DRAFT_142053 [Xylariaceae sp. FL0804]
MQLPVVESIGVLSGMLRIFHFNLEAMPERTRDTVSLTIAAAHDFHINLNHWLLGAGGLLPDVRVFNSEGRYLGAWINGGQKDEHWNTIHGKLAEGGQSTVLVDLGVLNDVDPAESGRPAHYALFSANDDAVCVPWIAATLQTGEAYAWTGDWGRQCGGSWYYANRVIPGTTDERPDCFWLDGNGDQPQTGFQVHWPDTVPGARDHGRASAKDKVDYMCQQGPPFKMYEGVDPTSIEYWLDDEDHSQGIGVGTSKPRAGGQEKKKKRRDVVGVSYGPPRRPASARFRYPDDDDAAGKKNGTRTRRSSSDRDMHAEVLVIGRHERHSAVALCESPTSRGPSFLNVAEGAFCRMTDRTLWPVCSSDDDENNNINNTIIIRDNCFNRELQQVIANGLATRDSPYKKVLDWTAEEEEQ